MAVLRRLDVMEPVEDSCIAFAGTGVLAADGDGEERNELPRCEMYPKLLDFEVDEEEEEEEEPSTATPSEVDEAVRVELVAPAVVALPPPPPPSMGGSSCSFIKGERERGPFPRTPSAANDWFLLRRKA